EQLRADAPGRVIAIPADVSCEDDVKRIADRVAAELGALDVLVCNAGVYGPKGTLENVDLQAWWRAVEINVLGTVICCRTFLPMLQSEERGKIIILSGGGAT